MSFTTARPSAADAEAAIRFVIDAWAALPPEPGDPDPVDLEFHRAYTRWLEAKDA